MKSGNPPDIPYGGACAWQLPPDASSAPLARSFLSSTMARLSFPVDLIDDGALAVTELAANSFQHAPRQGPYEPMAAPELWAWARTHPQPELVVTVFDPCRDLLPQITPGDLMDENGRGLGIVSAVTSCWGCHPTRSRLGGVRIPGKATWFAIRLPPWPNAHHVIAPSVAARKLLLVLGSRGVDGTRRSDANGISVITLKDLNVWVEPKSFSWQDGNGGYARHPLIDLQETAERLVQRVEERTSPPT